MMWILMVAALLLAAAAIFLTVYAYKRTFRSDRRRQQDREKLLRRAGSYRTRVQALMAELSALPCEDVYITSFDGLKLHGRYYRAAGAESASGSGQAGQSGHADESAGRVLEIMFHGYNGNALRDFCGGHKIARREGHDILLVDQRAHGQSEGKTISFGINERCDLLSWLQYVDARFGEDEYRIILSGVSMGAATVLMAAELALPAAVKGIIADCGYTSPRAIIKKVMKDAGFCPALLYPFVRLAARLAGGFDLDEASAVESVRHCRVPVLIIHGEADGFVPCSMAREIYAACACDKELLLVPGADHVMSYIVDTKRYEETVRRFIADCLSRP